MTGERRHGRPDNELAGLIQELDSIGRRLRTLERPTGTEINQSVQKLQEAQAKLEEQQIELERQQAELADRVDTRMGEWFDDVAPGLIADEVALQVAAAFAGNVSIGGNLDVAGAVTLPDVFATDVVALGGSRASAWVTETGRLGNTT